MYQDQCLYGFAIGLKFQNGWTSNAITRYTTLFHDRFSRYFNFFIYTVSKKKNSTKKVNSWFDFLGQEEEEKHNTKKKYKKKSNMGVEVQHE